MPKFDFDVEIQGPTVTIEAGTYKEALGKVRLMTPAEVCEMLAEAGMTVELYDEENEESVQLIP